MKSGGKLKMKKKTREQMSSKTSIYGDSDQLILGGILTERDIFRAIMRKIGARGGSACTPAQTEHRKRSMAKINARKRARMAERLKREAEGHGR